MDTYHVFPFALLAFSGLACAHPGGLDEQGGHTNRATETYHCHKEPCSSNWKKSQDAFKEAIEEKRAFTPVYDRSSFKHWSDFDSDCMNTRHEVLLSQSDGPVTLSPDGCYVSKGTWHDPFSGETFYKSNQLDIDHLVSLSWSFKRGAAYWSDELKEQFANDPLNLLAVDKGLNRQKSDKGPLEWMPPNAAFHCEYLNRWQQVLDTYPDLQMSEIELQDFSKKLSKCDTDTVHQPSKDNKIALDADD